jgi:hypothetical protein
MLVLRDVVFKTGRNVKKMEIKHKNRKKEKEKNVRFGEFGYSMV